MNIKSLFGLLQSADKKTWSLLAVAGFGLVSLAVGSYFTYETHFRHPQYSYMPVDEEWRQHLKEVVAVAQAAGDGEEKKLSSVLVDISGAVEKPGVYQISTPARYQDAVLMAGGFQEGVDKRYIHQQLNLAAQIQDQQKIYIPFQGETPLSGGVSNSQVVSAESSTTVNTASQKTLESISGIGPKRAEGIIAGRPYSDKDDFFDRAGLSQTLAETVLQELPSFDN